MNRPEAPLIPDVQSHPDAREARRSTASAYEACAIRSGSSTEAARRNRRSPFAASTSRCRRIARARTCRAWSRRSTSCASRCRWRRLPALPRHDAGRGSKPTPAASSIAFPWFMRKTAPVSGVQSMMDYEVKLVADAAPGKRSVEATVVVPVMSLCPSSKAISDYGAHNQRSHLTLTVRPRPGAGDHAGGADRAGRGRGLMRALRSAQARRREIRHRARLRPAAVRRGSRARHRGAAGRRRALLGFSVAAENFESIHNHSAYAEIVRG